jgi:hypothetical protein
MQRTSWTKPNQINETKTVEMRLAIQPMEWKMRAGNSYTLPSNCYHIEEPENDFFLIFKADIDSAYTSSKMLNIRSEDNLF